MAAPVDYSIELPHVYLRELTLDKAVLAIQAIECWISPLLSRLSAKGMTWSMCIMVDDYFYKPTDAVSPVEAVAMYQEACEKVGVTWDHIVLESAMADTVEKLLPMIVEQPRDGAGSRGGQKLEPLVRTGWLSNGDAMRQSYEPVGERMGTKWLGSAGRVSKPFYEHSIYLDIQLFDEGGTGSARRYACPTLAAWWQLVRLGIDREGVGRLRMPDGTTSRDGAHEFFARNTLSFLDPGFISVEHSVREILRQAVIPTELLSILRAKKSKSKINVLDRIHYVFLNTDHFLVQ